MSDPDNDFEAALKAFEQEQGVSAGKGPRVGEKIQGTIVSIGRDLAFVELGGKAEGQVQAAELRDDDGKPLYGVGDEIEALVTGESPDGGFLLRLRPGQGPALGEELREAFRNGMPVEGAITGINKGGAEVEVGGLRAFCPISQLADRFVEDASVFVGQKHAFRITKLEEAPSGRRPNIVLSRRALLEEEKRQRAEETRARLEVGAIVDGEVVSLASYGAFVDLGGLEGLLHVSQMSHGRIGHPSEIVAVGQPLRVQVLKIEDSDKGERISLSIRHLQEDPWHGIEHKLPLGQTVRGRVTRLESFGAFVEVLPGIEGLVHVSELGAQEHVRHAREVLSAGQPVEARVLGVDPEKRRVSLSIRAASAASAARQQKAAMADYRESRQEESTGFGSLADVFAKARIKKSGDESG